jgi:hypothetical protein
MLENILGKSVLEDLEEQTDVIAPINVAGVTIENPNDISEWVSKAISARGDSKERIFAEAVKYATTLPDEYKEDFQRSLLRAIREEYGDIPESLAKTETPQLTTAEIERIAQGASLRKDHLTEIDEYMALKDKPEEGGFMGGMIEEAKAELPRALEFYRNKFNEEYPGTEDLSGALEQMPKEVGNRFDAHGIDGTTKNQNLESLVALLTNGVESGKTLHSMPLIYDVNLTGLGAASPYPDGGIIVVGPVNGKDNSKKLIVDPEKATTNIEYVLLDREFYFAMPQLEKVFPKVKFVKASEAVAFFTEEVRDTV